MIEKVTGIYYGPSGETEDMTRRIAEEIAAALNECIPSDISLEFFDFNADEVSEAEFDDDSLVVIGMPSYMGKMPLLGIKALSMIRAAGTMALAAVSYGSTTYGNALYELKHYAEDRGFKVVGAGAFTIKRPGLIKRGIRETVIDEGTLEEFVRAASEKIIRLSGCEVEDLKIRPVPLEVRGRMPIHKISRVSPSAAAMAEALNERISIIKRKSEWFL